MSALATLIGVFLSLPLRADPPDPALLAELHGLSRSLSDGFAVFDSADAKQGPSGKVFVLFALTSWGGGNGGKQFLAVFQSNDAARLPDGRLRPLYSLETVVPIGRDFDRWFKQLELKGDRILLRGRRWARRDAHCCPSLELTTAYRLTTRGLIETTK